MTLKNIATKLNDVLINAMRGFFIGHGLPKGLMLWNSAILWGGPRVTCVIKNMDISVHYQHDRTREYQT